MDKKLVLTLIYLFGATIFSNVSAQELPPEEIQVNFNGYFDNADVNIVYPSVNASKKISENTMLNVLYQADLVSAASMKSSFDGVERSPFSPDGLSSASSKNTAPDAVSAASTLTPSITDPDDVRHEVVLGVTQVFDQTTVSMSGIYSTEHDYDSKTLALSLSHPLNQKNTVVQLGLVGSFDNVFPDIAAMKSASWEKSKDVFTFSGGVSQVLSPLLIAQLNLSYSTNSGFLSDPYQVVSIWDSENNNVRYFNTYHPDSRQRLAIGLRLNYSLYELTSLQVGYRYYWDDWEINSHTFNIFANQYFLEKNFTVGAGIRYYTQTNAYFFKPEYDMAWINDGNYFTVDNRLDAFYSLEYELSLKFSGSLFKDTPVVGLAFQGEGSQMILGFNFYQRHNDTPDWFIGYNTLYAYILSLGFRFPF